MSTQIEHITIAIDESGGFVGDKLTGNRSKSTVVAIMSYLSEDQLFYKLDTLCAQYHIESLSDLHAMELRDRYGKLVANQVIQDMNQITDGKLAVMSKIDRMIFHEQQAYGETLFALLRNIADQWRDILLRVKKISIIIATRGRKELMGFADKDEYHDALLQLVKERLPHMNWPKVHHISFQVATRNPFLMLADFAAFGSTRGSHDWVLPMTTLSNVDDERKFRTLINQQVPALSWMNLITQDKKLPVKQNIKKRGVDKVEAILLSLIGFARQHLDTRHQDGSLRIALKICNAVWEAVEDPAPFNRYLQSFKIQCCFIALETLSHLGATTENNEVTIWKIRRHELQFSDPFNQLKVDFEMKLHEAQSSYFNLFKFEDAYLEVLEWYHYYLNVTHAFNHHQPDQILGRLLGTIGQATGFLRPIDPVTAKETISWLQESAKHFSHEPQSLFAQMNVGYQLTDLWDTQQLDELQQRLSQHIPINESTAHHWNALHYVRFLALKKELQSLTDDEQDMVLNFRNYIFQSFKTMNTFDHPLELLAKWSLYLYPNDSDLINLVSQSIDQLAPTIAIKATSLPLLTQLQMWDRVQSNIEHLVQVPEFALLWESDRMSDLKQQVEAKQSANTFKALTAMPWNYS